MKRRHFLLLACGSAALSMGGCSWFNGTMRSQSPDESNSDEPQTRLIGDIAVPTGVWPVRVEAIGLITGLRGTGSDPSPSPQRAALVEEMQIRGIANPDTVLASGDVSLVMMQGYLRPGIQKGDRFDIELRVPSQSDTKSLRGGFLLETRLKEMRVVENESHQSRVLGGNLLALAKGPVLVDPTADKTDRLALCRGRIPGGGVCLKNRPLGLVLTKGHRNALDDSKPDPAAVKSRLQHAMYNSKVANAVNKRFHTMKNGVKIGMAKAVDDQLVELQLHPRYKDNIARYMQVVRSIPLSESATERTGRIASLERRLLDPNDSAEAAVQLEALGTEGMDTLLKGVASKDPEVRFYAAEALAYLDRREAAEPLGEIAREQPAFRVFALTALSAMQDFAAYSQLRDLLSMPSAETRYGAFRALWAMNDKDPLVKGEILGDQFHYHVLDVAGPPMIHLTRNRLAEIVLFGADQRLLVPVLINAGNEIMLKSSPEGDICVSKYSVADGDQKRTVSTRLDDVIRAIVELGGTYPDVVQALEEAMKLGAVASRLEVDALPEAGRSYDRMAADDSDTSEAAGRRSADNSPKKTATPASPSPELFDKPGANHGASEKADDNTDDEEEKPKKGFFSKMFGR
ncbi:MAG: flagellar basal body P-ring protein FlgI [Planctomycetaceae bacterium]|nr:flagellar basal body P-ring protein FlgI [Planctomycetaceae bacterium]